MRILDWLTGGAPDEERPEALTPIDMMDPLMRNRLMERMAHVLSYVGLVIADRDETIWWANREFTEMMGYNYNSTDGSSELVGQKIYILINATSRQRHTQVFQAHVDDPHPLGWIGPVDAVKKNGVGIQIKIKPGAVTMIADRMMASTNVIEVNAEDPSCDG